MSIARWRAAFAWTTLALAALCAAPVFAQDEGPQDPPAREKADPFALPADDTLEEWAKAFKRIVEFQPTSRAEAEDFQRIGIPAAAKAAERILALEEDKTSDLFQEAETFVLMFKMQQIADLEPKQRAGLIEMVAQRIKKAETPGREEVGMALQLTQALEYGGFEELAGDAAARFAESLKDVKIAGVEDDIPGIFAAVARRLRLPGNELVLTGTKMDGTPFDVTSLKGKVVLVDFWATWCGPCIAEMPNVRKHYDALKDRGFEVVGVSLDQDREALEAFIKDREVPWMILHNQEEPGTNEATKYYGIMGIPTMILVGRDGKVISTQARGEVLDELLAKQFPPEGEQK